jgi:SsrA-binding protein
MKKSKEDKIIIARNKKALRDFFILDRYEAGIVLKGSEVKSIREHKVNLRDSYGQIRKGELMLYNMHITPYSKSRVEDINPVRVRKLLMHRREIDRIAGKLTDKSLTLVPLSIYIAGNLAKIEIAIAKGKAKRDKRRDIEKKEHEREIRRAFKNF